MIPGDVGRSASASWRLEALSDNSFGVDADEVLRRMVLRHLVGKEASLTCERGHVLGVTLQGMLVDRPAVATCERKQQQSENDSRYQVG